MVSRCTSTFFKSIIAGACLLAAGYAVVSLTDLWQSSRRLYVPCVVTVAAWVQMTLSTAQLLSSKHGFRAFGDPTKATLLSCVPAMYYAAAFIDHLSAFGGVRRGLCFSVKAFFAGMVSMHDSHTEALTSTSECIRVTQLV